MTKAKARARAKARAAVRASNPEARGAKPEIKVRSNQFDVKSNTMRSIGGDANIKSIAGMKRGSGRSR
jgi:hypothetical protein